MWCGRRFRWPYPHALFPARLGGCRVRRRRLRHPEESPMVATVFPKRRSIASVSPTCGPTTGTARRRADRRYFRPLADPVAEDYLSADHDHDHDHVIGTHRGLDQGRPRAIPFNPTPRTPPRRLPDGGRSGRRDLIDANLRRRVAPHHRDHRRRHACAGPASSPAPDRPGIPRPLPTSTPPPKWERRRSHSDRAVANTSDRHNVIVCTLCSCYPRR